MSSSEPDVFKIIMKFLFQVCVYFIACTFSVYFGTKILRALGVTP